MYSILFSLPGYLCGSTYIANSAHYYPLLSHCKQQQLATKRHKIALFYDFTKNKVATNKLNNLSAFKLNFKALLR